MYWNFSSESCTFLQASALPLCAGLIRSRSWDLTAAAVANCQQFGPKPNFLSRFVWRDTFRLRVVRVSVWHSLYRSTRSSGAVHGGETVASRFRYLHKRSKSKCANLDGLLSLTTPLRLFVPLRSSKRTQYQTGCCSPSQFPMTGCSRRSPPLCAGSHVFSSRFLWDE